MKRIPLSRGMIATVDDEDYARIATNKWFAQQGARAWYAKREAKHGRAAPSHMVYMHREIVNAPPGSEVDHINGDGLDNRRSNLRVSTRRENARNLRKKPGCASRFKGVARTRGGRWRAYISDAERYANGKARQRALGSFDSEIDAARAYDAAARLSFGSFASLNFPEGR